MHQAPNPIYENKSGSTTLNFVFTILITGALFLVLPLSQLRSDEGPVDPENPIRTTSVNPPPKYVPPPLSDHEDDQKEPEIELKLDFEKLTISEIDHLITGGQGKGVRYPVTSFHPDDFSVDHLIYDPENLDTHPKALAQAAPSYPPELKRDRIEGHVSVIYIVSDKGVVRNIRITEASNRGFVDSVMTALRRWNFEPGKVSDKPVNTRVRQTFHFTLKN